MMPQKPAKEERRSEGRSHLVQNSNQNWLNEGRLYIRCPWLVPTSFYKGSGHPFYEAVYRKAAKINKKFADNMDTCIIK